VCALTVLTLCEEIGCILEGSRFIPWKGPKCVDDIAPWSSVLIEKLVVPELVKIVTVIYIEFNFILGVKMYAHDREDRVC
jgi:hypothetical protein